MTWGPIVAPPALERNRPDTLPGIIRSQRCGMRCRSTRPRPCAPSNVCSASALPPDVDGDLAPMTLAETGHAQHAPCDVPQEDRAPNVHRFESARLLDHPAEPQRKHDLRRERDVEGTARVPCALKPARVGQRD